MTHTRQYGENLCDRSLHTNKIEVARWILIPSLLLSAMAAFSGQELASPMSLKQSRVACMHMASAATRTGIKLEDIRNVNPSISTTIATRHGVAFIPANHFGDSAPAYCLLTGSVTTNPLAGKTANFGAALPMPGAWNGRLLMQGCGGTCGDVFSNGPPAATLVQRGYAVWTTDDGHIDDSYAATRQPVTAGSHWAIKRPGVPDAESIEDYAHRAVHVVAQTGRAVTERIYGKQPLQRAYFLGCSDGGREGIQEAMLHPDDFDGIVAGAPLLDIPTTVLGGMASQLIQLRSADSILPMRAFDIVSDAIRDKCDAEDGVRDGLVQNPAACSFDPQVDISRCGSAQSGDRCLSQVQIDVFSSIFSGVRSTDNRVAAMGVPTISTGARPDGGWGLASWVAFALPAKHLDGAFPFGTEAQIGLAFWAWSFSDGLLRNLVAYGQEGYDSGKALGMLFVGRTSDDPHQYRARMASDALLDVQNATRPIISANPYLMARFIDGDHKLLIWHGYADGLLNAYVSINFYEDLARLHGGYGLLKDSVRLFMAPDVAHCGWGGAGPSAIQTLYHKLPGELPPPRLDADHDVLMAMEKWVETAAPPRQLVASKYQDDDPGKAVVRTMPLCPYPAKARYLGHGDVNQADSWICDEEDVGLLTVGKFGRDAGRH